MREDKRYMVNTPGFLIAEEFYSPFFLPSTSSRGEKLAQAGRQQRGALINHLCIQSAEMQKLGRRSSGDAEHRTAETRENPSIE